MKRRDFLGLMLAAPAIVRASSLMGWRATTVGLLVPAGPMIYVASDTWATSLVRDGRSWDAAFRSIDDAAMVWRPGSTVMVYGLNLFREHFSRLRSSVGRRTADVTLINCSVPNGGLPMRLDALELFGTSDLCPVPKGGE